MSEPHNVAVEDLMQGLLPTAPTLAQDDDDDSVDYDSDMEVLMRVEQADATMEDLIVDVATVQQMVVSNQGGFYGLANRFCVKRSRAGGVAIQDLR